MKNYYSYIENLSKKIKDAKETNNLEREKKLKGFSRLLSICSNIYKIIDYYDKCKEFEEIRRFFYFITNIFCGYIEGKKISLDRLENILECISYEYSLNGGGRYEIEKRFLSLGKFFVEDEGYYEYLYIPIPITKTDEWYNDLKSINSR